MHFELLKVYYCEDDIECDKGIYYVVKTDDGFESSNIRSLTRQSCERFLGNCVLNLLA